MSAYRESKLIRGFDIKYLKITESEELFLLSLIRDRKETLQYVSSISVGTEYHKEGHSTLIGFKNEYEAGDNSETTKEEIDLEEHMEWTNDYYEEFYTEIMELLDIVTNNQVNVPDAKWILGFYEY